MDRHDRIFETKCEIQDARRVRESRMKDREEKRMEKSDVIEGAEALFEMNYAALVISSHCIIFFGGSD